MSNEHQPPATYRESGYQNSQPMRSGTYPRPAQLKLKPKTTSKPVLKGHEALLKAIEATQAKITIELLDDPKPIVGFVKHSDKYTISVESTNDLGEPRTYVVFKHAIRLFGTAPAPKKVEVEAVVNV